VEPLAALAERVLLALVRAGDETVQRDRDMTPKLAHRASSVAGRKGRGRPVGAAVPAALSLVVLKRAPTTPGERGIVAVVDALDEHVRKRKRSAQINDGRTTVASGETLSPENAAL
jgi:hypothetical protein